jgi:hypothetical protein
VPPGQLFTTNKTNPAAQPQHLLFKMLTSAKPICLSAALLTTALLCFILSSVSAEEWTYGRATFYDDNQQ